MTVREQARVPTQDKEAQDRSDAAGRLCWCSAGLVCPPCHDAITSRMRQLMAASTDPGEKP